MFFDRPRDRVESELTRQSDGDCLASLLAGVLGEWAVGGWSCLTVQLRSGILGRWPLQTQAMRRLALL
eukprot:8085114-Alexandrium_andersonii.AAC.1